MMLFQRYRNIVSSKTLFTIGKRRYSKESPVKVLHPDPIHSYIMPPIVFSCEHANGELPLGYKWKGSDKDLVGTHWALDIGAAEMTSLLCELTGGHGVLGSFSRLLVDVNRPLEGPNSDTLFRPYADGNPVLMNSHISAHERNNRIEQYYKSYHHTLAHILQSQRPHLLLSIHSFTPMYEGKRRDVEIGVLYSRKVDEQLALKIAEGFKEKDGIDARINEPWSADMGFMHCANTHVDALNNNNNNNNNMNGDEDGTITRTIMLEFRQDLVVHEQWRWDVAHSLLDMLKLYLN